MNSAAKTARTYRLNTVRIFFVRVIFETHQILGHLTIRCKNGDLVWFFVHMRFYNIEDVF